MSIEFASFQNRFQDSQWHQNMPSSNPLLTCASQSQFNPTCTNLNEAMKKALETQPQHSSTPYCTRPQPCPTALEWKSQWRGCGPQWKSWAEIKGVKGHCQSDVRMAHGMATNPQDVRIWVADLNPVLFERSLLSGAEWRPEPYNHPRGRQMFLQQVHSTLVPQKSPHEKQVDRIEDTFMYIKNHGIQPQYYGF